MCLEVAEEVRRMREAIISFRCCQIMVCKAEHTLPRKDDDAPTYYLPAEQFRICDVRSTMIFPDIFVNEELRTFETEPGLLH